MTVDRGFVVLVADFYCKVFKLLITINVEFLLIAVIGSFVIQAVFDRGGEKTFIVLKSFARPDGVDIIR